MSATDIAVIPGNPVPLARVAKQLGKATHVLVDASRRGEFPHVVKVGAVWFVSSDAVRDWFARQHAADAPTVNPAARLRVRQAGQAEAAAPQHRRPRRPRERTAGSC